MLTRLLSLCGALLLMLVAHGCASGDCTSSSDCAADQLCQAGSCVDRCASNNDCEANRVCRAGVCELLPRCTTTSDCAGGEVCDDGICRAQVEECDGDSDCPPNFTCFEGGCYAPGTRPDAGDGGCVGCANGETCIDGECVRLDAGRPDADAVADADEDTDEPDVEADADADDADAAADAGDDADEDAEVDADDASDADDVSEDADADADATPDTAPDADVMPDAPVDADTGCRGSADCPDGQICLGGVCSDPPSDVVEDTAPDVEEEVIECVGSGTGQLGDRCGRAADCCNDQCFGAEPNGVCTQSCGEWDDCNPEGVPRELFCYRGGGPSTQFCTESIYLDACSNVNQCFGGVPGMVCRIPGAAGLGRCTYECGASDECRGDSACGPVDLANGVGSPVYRNLCTPVGTPCATFRDCLSGLCLEDDAGPNYCTAYCDPVDPESCPTGFGCVTGIDGTIAGYGACILLP